ncbi:WYL domain-containing protein [Chloroflexia bacterium SDU3-3]|nr:WYL domain-containing protein [Chloroflexia bacterium SDU3-3]
MLCSGHRHARGIAMNRTFARSERYLQIEKLLLATKVPLSQAEIARRCGVSPATISRMVQSLADTDLPLRVDEHGWLYLERTAYISTLRLRLHEAMSLFLAGRLLARYSDRPNAHTVEALEKLGLSLQGVMPHLGGHMVATAAALRQRLPRQASEHQRALEKLTEAWANGVKVQIWYRPLHAARAYQHTFAPYFLEPSAIGHSTYVIGMAEPPGKLRTRKLERIERVLVTDEPFDLPADFDPQALLAGAWGIWFDEGDKPTAVTLRFADPMAVRRVEETIWHPSERKERDAAGRLIWRAEVDELQEMLPWIRGWGAACEVIEPRGLREQQIGELRRQMRMYGLDRPAADGDGPDLDLLGSLFGG